MAALDCYVSSGTQSLASSTAKTVLQLKAATNQRVKLKAWALTVGGTTVKDLTVSLIVQSDAGTATTTLTPVKTLGAAETVQTVAKTGFTVEPSSSSTIEHKRLQSSYEKIYPLGQEKILAGGGYLGLVVTCTGDTASVAGEFTFEE